MRARVPGLLAVALLTSACPHDCDWEAEVEALLLEDTVDCGHWERLSGDDEPVECAYQAIADGRDYRFSWDHVYGHATTFSREGRVYVVFRLDGGPFPPKTDTGVEVVACEGTLDEELPHFEEGGTCHGEIICNVCPRDEQCPFGD